MTCCPPTADRGIAAAAPRATGTAGDEVLLASRVVGDDLRQTDLSVPGIHCGGCIRAIETALGALPGVEYARVNLSNRRVAIRWRQDGPPPPFQATLAGLGYEAHLYDADGEGKDPVLGELVRALAIAGFAASNIMLLSVSVWSGAEPATRDLFHWISAGIALPALIYSGRIFFRSAWSALRHGRTNMDVPISIGVSLAFAMSLYETINQGREAYFDASVSLLFFLLVGRTLDHMTRQRARTAVTGLARLAARGATVQRSDGSRDFLPVSEIEPGMTILLTPGERVPVDARVKAGSSDIDRSLVSGESEPQAVGPGALLQAGTMNLTGALTITATAAAKDSFLAEMVRLMEAAEAGRSRYRRLADRVSRLYAPTVHLAALFAFAGWVLATGDYHRAITIAVAVLIITCPCALGLAVPMVQVAAARRLFENGIMVKDGSAMERLDEVDTVVFDKTGTLTLAGLRLSDADRIDPAHLAIGASIALHSNHPHSRALAGLAGRNAAAVAFDGVREHPGLGIEGIAGPRVFRLGRASWALATQGSPRPDEDGTVLSEDGRLLEVFRFDDRLRPGAVEALADLQRIGLEVEMLSGDRATAVEEMAARLGIARFEAGALPGEKTARLAALAEAGRKVLMVGDGLNDAPALVAAHVSMAPATAADVGRNAADFVFLRESLDAVPLTIAVAREAGRLIRQNFAIAILYNVIALPVAVMGYVTPLVAALAMSGSSVIVVANAFRLSEGRLRGRAPSTSAEGQGALAVEAG